MCVGVAVLESAPVLRAQVVMAGHHHKAAVGAAFPVSITTAAVRAAVLLTAQPGRGPRPRLQKPAHPEDAATMPTLTPPPLTASGASSTMRPLLRARTS